MPRSRKETAERELIARFQALSHDDQLELLRRWVTPELLRALDALRRRKAAQRQKVPTAAKPSPRRRT